MEQKTELQKGFASLINLFEDCTTCIRLHSSGIWTNTGWHREAGSIAACEIICIFEGASSLRIGDKSYTPKSGEIFFYDLSEKSYCEPGHFKLYFLTLQADSEEVYQQLRQGIAQISKAQPFRSSELIEKSIQRIMDEESDKKPHWSTIISYLLTEIFIDLYRQHEAETISVTEFPYEPRKAKITDDVMQILNARYLEDISLKEIGRKLALNPRYINAVFKEINGTTIRQHLIRIRLGAAKQLLKFTSMNVTDIAMETGFSDCQHFCRSFKKHENITPLNFRNRSNQ
jgi:YesN/AraC family two-component response regulator